MFVEHKEEGEVKELDAPAKLLLKAADLIEKHGWCQNALNTSDGRMCIMGAVSFAAHGTPHSLEFSDDEGIAVMRFGIAVEDPAHHWNDRHGRTKAEVVAKLRAVALS